MLQDVSLDFLVNFVPVFFNFGASRIGDFLLGLSLWDAESISSQERPIVALSLLFHDYFNAVEAMIGFGAHWNDLPKKYQIEMIDFLRVFDGKVDTDLI